MSFVTASDFKLLDGWNPLPDARLSHLRKPRAINVHGKQLYLCQYTGELSPKAYGVSIYGVRQGSFRDLGCLLSFLVSCCNNEKTTLKEKEQSYELYQEIFKALSLESQSVPVAPSPMTLSRFGGDQLRLDDKYIYHIPDLSADEESKWLFNPDLHTEHEEKPKEPRLEIQVPMDFDGDFHVLDHREANLRSLRHHLSVFLEEHHLDVEKTCVAFKHTNTEEESEFAMSFLNRNGKAADFIVRPYRQAKPMRKPSAPRSRKVIPTKEQKKDRKKELKKMDKEQSKTIVAEILADSKLMAEERIIAIKNEDESGLVDIGEENVSFVTETGIAPAVTVSSVVIDLDELPSGQPEHTEKMKRTVRKSVKRLAEEIENKVKKEKKVAEAAPSAPRTLRIRKKKDIPSADEEPIVLISLTDSV